MKKFKKEELEKKDDLTILNILNSISSDQYDIDDFSRDELINVTMAEIELFYSDSDDMVPTHIMKKIAI